MSEQLSVVTPEWLQSNKNAVSIVDVREPREFEAIGHIPDAVNVPYESFRDPSTVSTGKLPSEETFEELLSEAGISRDEPIVAYDAERGVYAARFLLTAAVYGHDGPLYLLDGGLEAWRTRGELGTGTESPESTSYSVRKPESAPILDREAVEAAVDGDAVLVDTRTPAEYSQAHIPGAVQLGWEELLDDGRLRPAAEIEALLEEKGIDRNRRIVLYCNTARRLSHTYVVLSELGYESVEFYEGSLTDWIRAQSPDWDPVELYERVYDLAPEGFDALPRELGEDIFSRLHLIGLYTQKQDGYFMLRTKVPGGQLTAEQARTFGEIADEFARAPPEHGGEEQNPQFGDGFLDVTTRQGLQLHWIRLEDMPEIWDRYEEVGLTTIQASGNTLRNVVTCPAAGKAEESYDPRDLAEEIADAFEGNTKYANLPRKFKVSLTGCHENCGRAEIQDVGLTPAIKEGREGFHVKVGGGLSDGPRAATDFGVFLPPEQVTEFTLALAELFIDHGSYLDTAVNRLRFLVEEWGVDRVREELQRYVSFEFEESGEDLTTGYRGDHVGIHEQADENYYVGLNLPTGRMRGEELVELADLSETYGSGELRTTANQNLVVTDIPPENVDSLREEPLLSRYSPEPGPFSQGIVTCTGSEFCSYGVIETKNRGMEWATQLDEWLAESDVDEAALPDAFRIHMSGCSASCAQPQIADIGMRGERYRDDHREVAAADVGLGGNLGSNTFIDWVAGSVPLESIPNAIQRLVTEYEGDRLPEESFAEWVERRPAHELRALIENDQPQQLAVKSEGD